MRDASSRAVCELQLSSEKIKHQNVKMLDKIFVMNSLTGG